MTLDHKTSHKCQFFAIEIYKSSESWINKLSNWCMVCYDRTIFGRDTIIWKSEIWGAKNLNTEKIAFKAVQMKFLAMHITNQKWSFHIFTVGNLQNIFMEHDVNVLMTFWHKRKMDNFDPYNVFLAIATNIPQWLKTMFCGPGSYMAN